MAYVLREMELNYHVLLSVMPEQLAPTLLDEAIGARQPENGDG